MLSDLFKVKIKHFQSITEAAVGAEHSILHFVLNADSAFKRKRPALIARAFSIFGIG